MRWEVKKIKDGIDKGKWGIFLCEEFWKYPDKPVCYGASINKKSANETIKRMNDPNYWTDQY
jgi:hypothetical protein